MAISKLVLFLYLKRQRKFAMRSRFSTSPVLRWLVLSLSAVCMTASRPVSVQERYIEQFKLVAVSEMERTGIPASIKMAQALHESQSGRSELATQANNHFGIKCKTTWSGATYQYKDDDRDSTGSLVFSCFRSYPTAMESYMDHSDFLKYRPRYRELFELPLSDYKSWAYGLKKCGYATDPNYPERLIKIIERYNLDLLDAEGDSSQIQAPAMAAEPTADVRAIAAVEILSRDIRPLACAKHVVKTSVKKNVSKYKVRKRSSIRKKR